MKDYKTLSADFMSMLLAMHRNFFRRASLLMPLSQFGVLMILNDEGAMSSGTMADILRISKQQLTPITNKLSSKNMISRSTAKEDRRVTMLSLTKKGKKFIDDFKENFRERIENDMRILTDAEFDRLAEAVSEINETRAKIDSHYDCENIETILLRSDSINFNANNIA